MINMGQSPDHASTIPLVLNPQTGAIKAIYHCIHDDYFATIAVDQDALESNGPDPSDPIWANLFGDSVYQHPDANEHDPDVGTPPTPASAMREEHVRFAQDSVPVQPLPPDELDPIASS